ncbi:MAG: phage tail protein [Nitrospirae bacterium]|nr:phage tail protein [Nitrospirota bacterium]
MADRTGSDPYRQFNFLVEVDGVIVGGFSEVSGLTAEVDAGDYRDGRQVREVGGRLPGVRKAATIMLRHGWTQDKRLLDWCQAALKGEQKLVSGSIILVNEARQVKRRWTFSRGMPVKCLGPDRQATGNGARIETLEFTFERLELART